MKIAFNRLFFALWPDDGVRAACAEAARELRVKLPPGGRVSDPARFHITLAFLGSTLTPEQEAAARQVASLVRAPPFTLSLDHAGSFRKRQAVWWLGARDTPPELALLHQRLHEGLTAARVAPDRTRFVPHLTIVRDATQALPQTAIRPIRWPARDFVLVRSHVERQPPEYEVIGRWPLAGDAAAAPDQLALWDNERSK